MGMRESRDRQSQYLDISGLQIVADNHDTEYFMPYVVEGLRPRAPHDPLVTINENTSAWPASRVKPCATNHWRHSEKTRREGGCGTTRAER
jgi:hypothetical protein